MRDIANDTIDTIEFKEIEEYLQNLQKDKEAKDEHQKKLNEQIKILGEVSSKIEAFVKNS